MPTHVASQLAWERMVTAVEKVRARLRRAARALEDANIPYAVAGGHAVAVHVAEVDEAAVRNTPDVDIIIRREDLECVKEVLTKEGFAYRHAATHDMFLDGPHAKGRDAVRVMFAREKTRPEYVLSLPDVEETKQTETARYLPLESLVRMELSSFRTVNCVHLRDLIDVGLLDSSWSARLPAVLMDRLQSLLDTPEG